MQKEQLLEQGRMNMIAEFDVYNEDSRNDDEKIKTESTDNKSDKSMDSMQRQRHKYIQ